MNEYTTIQHFCEDEFIEKRSRFIGAATTIKSHEDALDFVSKRKSDHYDARHNVWAYILKDGSMKYSDDGEPQGTGGMPVLEVIRRQGLVDICVVVTRYFGGILLGAGGLTRAYSKGAVIALEKAERITATPCDEIVIIIDYPRLKTMDKLLIEHNAVIDNVEYFENIKISGAIKSTDTKTFKKALIECFSGTVNIEITSECYRFMPNV